TRGIPTNNSKKMSKGFISEAYAAQYMCTRLGSDTVPTVSTSMHLLLPDSVDSGSSKAIEIHEQSCSYQGLTICE
ncbi:MAG: hypothetical protein KZQ72_05300, partial [Candidatus Thiodiazotropha sp. (ex Cardiolucina cf. quadrata)]|nr:hypothetical protein [Candidatus Thiodiazotropha sp. (ex Cardiolucina cf. quadrata)]